MKKEWLKSKFGYDIPCCNQINGEEKTLIICHGFGSSKDSPMIKALQKVMPTKGIGTYSFDFPAHGESPVNGSFLRVPHCLEDLKTVENHILQLSPHSQICYFGSSFGAYIMFLYLAMYPHSGQKSFARSAAVTMSQIFQGWLTEYKLTPQALTGGNPIQDSFKLDDIYSRSFFITRAFLTDLEQYDLFRLYPKEVGSLYMIHGSLDCTAPALDAARFAKLSGATFQLLKGAEHRLMGSGEMDIVLESAIKFLM